MPDVLCLPGPSTSASACPWMLRALRSGAPRRARWPMSPPERRGSSRWCSTGCGTLRRHDAWARGRDGGRQLLRFACSVPLPTEAECWQLLKGTTAMLLLSSCASPSSQVSAMKWHTESSGTPLRSSHDQPPDELLACASVCGRARARVRGAVPLAGASFLLRARRAESKHSLADLDAFAFARRSITVARTCCSSSLRPAAAAIAAPWRLALAALNGAIGGERLAIC